MRAYNRNPYRLGSRSWIQERQFSVNKFANGLNNSEPDNLIADDECCDCLNMIFTDHSVMEKRPGFDVYGVYTWIREYGDLIKYDEFVDITRNVTWQIFFCEIAVCAKSSNDDTAIIVIDCNKDVQGYPYNGKYYFVTGEDNGLMMFDPTVQRLPSTTYGQFYRILSTPIYEVETDGNNSNRFYMKDEYYDDFVLHGGGSSTNIYIMGIETNISSPEEWYYSEIYTISHNPPVTKTGYKVFTLREEISATQLDLPYVYNVSNFGKFHIYLFVPLDDTHTMGEIRTDSYRIGNSETDYYSIWYEPCELEIADPYAGVSYVPDKPNVLTIHKNRLFIAGDSKQPHGFYPSRTENPVYFPVNAGMSVKPDGQKIIDMIVFDNALIIGRTEDMYALYGNSEYQDTSDNPFYIKTMDVSSGFFCKQCGALLNNYYIYLGSDGRFYKLNTPTTFVEYLVTAPLTSAIDIQKSPINLPISSLDYCHATAFRNEIYFACRKRYESSVNTYEDEYVTLVYSYNNYGFTYFKSLMLSPVYYFTLDNNLCYTMSFHVMHYTIDDPVYNDHHSPIECQYTTKRFDLNDPISFKFFKQFMITSHAFEDTNSNISVKVEVDYGDKQVELSLQEIIPSNSSLFDNALWESSFFDSPALYKSKYYMINAKSRTIKFILSNSNVNESMRIYDLNLLYTIRDIR